MKHKWAVTLTLLLFFMAAQVIGLAITYNYIDFQQTEVTGELEWKELPSFFGLSMERPDVEPQYSVWYILVAILIGTILILLIIKYARYALWKIWFFFAVMLCLHIAFAAWLPAVLSLLLAIIAGVFKVFKPNLIVHNITELFLYGGLAVIFVPILNVFWAFILLIALSAYDMYAVWKSKHMVKMAKFQTESKVFAGLLIPYKMPKIAKKAKAVKETVKTAVLGGGDIGFPLIFAGTLLKTTSFSNALIVSAGSAVALLVLLLLSRKDRFYPAMPFLTAGCAVGYLVSLL